MAVPQSFLDLLQQQKRRTKLTGVPQDPYGYAVAAAAGAPGRLETARTQKLTEAEVGTQAEQFGQSLAQQKLHFTESLTEQKRAAFAREREAGISTEAQMKAAKEAETMGYVGLGVQAPLSIYAGSQLFGTEAVVAEGVGMGTGTTVAEGTTLASGATAETGIIGAGQAIAEGATLGEAWSGMGLGSQIAVGVGGAYLGGKLLETTEGVKEIPSEIAEAGSFVADVIEAPFKAIASIVGGGKVLCTELHRQGLLPDDIYKADSEYGRQIDPITIKGYHLWGIPLAKAMQKSKVVTYMVKPLIDMWAYHMAYKMNIIEKDNLGGIILEAVGLPLCKWIGSFKTFDVGDTVFP